MIPPEAQNQFNDIIVHEMFEMQRSMGARMAATQAEQAARGTGQSGIAMHLLGQDAINSLKARSQFILGQLLRVLTAHRVSLTEENLSEAAQLLRGKIEAEAQMVRSHTFSLGTFNCQGQVLGPARRQVQVEFDQEAPRLIARLTTELRLAAAASNATTPPSAGPTFNFSGPVAVVQTGDGSQATVAQHLDAGTRSEIVQALQVLLEQIDGGSDEIPRRSDLRELVIEAKTEAEKPSPNSLKLGSSIRTIAETTKFIGSLGPAYQVIKPLLSYFGIHLP
jgi:hypothetical protein